MFTANSEAQQITMNNAFLGTIPERILIALVKTLPLLFLPVRLHSTFIIVVMRNLLLCGNAFQHPSEPLDMNYSSPFGATWAYETLISRTGIHHDDRAPMITLGVFTQGFNY